MYTETVDESSRTAYLQQMARGDALPRADHRFIQTRWWIVDGVLTYGFCCLVISGTHVSVPCVPMSKVREISKYSATGEEEV